MAGVKFIIMSLWEIPDKETVEFMGSFYKNLLLVKDIKQAFSIAQKDMRTKYDPYYWGAFVLLE
jgi:CHAT domain-containing protein